MNAVFKIESRIPASTRANNRLRNEGIVPANICRVGESSISVQMRRDLFIKKLNELGIAAIFNLDIDGKKRINAMVTDIQKETLTGNILNVTFQQVSLKEKVKMNVAVRVVNTKNLELNNLIVSMHQNTLPIVALPQNIPDYIDVDATNLNGDDKVFVKDLVLPKKTETDADMEELVLSIAFSKKPKVGDVATEEETATEEE